MIFKTLCAEEYPILEDFPDKFVPDPRTSIAIVGFDDGKPVARAFLLAPVHLEGPFLEEKYRSGIFGKQLMEEIERQARQMSLTKIFAYAVDQTIESYLTRLNYQRQQMTVWVKEL